MKGGIDQGPCPNYWKLSYRRKFISTCWVSAVCVGILVLLDFVPSSRPTLFDWKFTVLVAVTSAVQAGYLYWRWQQEKKLTAEG